MRINEFKSLEEFTSQYIGEWAPSEGHWFGLDFSYKGIEYRLHTGSMYNSESTILQDGREAMFGLYIKVPEKDESSFSEQHMYELLGEYADMAELLKSTVICGTPFKDIIMDDSTELLGQD